MGLAAALLWVLGGLAEPAVELRWEAVAGCPDAATVGAGLDAMVHEGSPPGAVAVTGRLESERGAYVLHLEVALVGRREARTLRAHDCAALTRAGVLVAAVAVDALAATAALAAVRTSAGAERPESTLSPEPEPDATPRPGVERRGSAPRVGPRPPRTALGAAGDQHEGPTRTAPGATPAGPRPSVRPRARGVGLGVGVGASSGLTPGLAVGLEGELVARLGSLRLAAAGYHWFARATELQPQAGVQAALSGGSLRGCLAFARARLEVPLCTGLELAAMHGGGIGATVRRREARDLWVGVAVGAGVVVWVVERFALHARADGVLALRTPAMTLAVGGEPREVFRMPPVGVRLLVGPLVRLW